MMLKVVRSNDSMGVWLLQGAHAAYLGKSGDFEGYGYNALPMLWDRPAITPQEMLADLETTAPELLRWIRGEK